MPTSGEPLANAKIPPAMSADSFGRPPSDFDFHRQYKRNPARCHRITRFPASRSPRRSAHLVPSHTAPQIPADRCRIRKLIRDISLANPLWGAPRIHGQLLKLGITIGQTTVAKYMVRTRRPRSQGWKTFLRNHANGIHLLCAYAN